MSCAITLKTKGLKLTPQRRLILDIIHDTHTHLTAEDILNYVQSKAPGVNKSTVYRTLELLEELGCVFKSEIDNKFIYHHAEEGHHHHLVCRSCGRSIECSEDLFLPIDATIREKYGFKADLKHLVISGLCRNCRTRAK
jgi:Fur family ferric uptake transcriptional regulator